MLFFWLCFDFIQQEGRNDVTYTPFSFQITIVDRCLISSMLSGTCATVLRIRCNVRQSPLTSRQFGPSDLQNR